MIPHYSEGPVTLYHGDCIEVMCEIGTASVDAVVTDPPYALNFMGRGWDQYKLLDFEVWVSLWARECLRVLKPGGHLLAFGGSRTWHRLTAGIEDAGFEIRDSIAWLYGSGFPKSLDVSKAIDAHLTGTEDAYAYPQWEGWGTALKPAFEPIVVARKPLTGTVAGNVLAYGTGALNIGASRVGTSGGGTQCGNRDDDGKCLGHGNAGRSTSGETFHGPDSDGGRWPTNVVLDESQAEALDAQTGTLTSGALKPYKEQHDNASSFRMAREKTYTSAPDSGGASRFFPTFRYEAKAPTSERPKAGEVQHPTVKPLDLMRWLVRLVTPPGGVVLEPFAGSGTTVEAAVLEGFECIAIEREADYLPLIVKRLSKPMQQSLFDDMEGDAA